MEKTIQHNQTALIARISTTCATDDEPVPDTARSGRANAIISPSRSFKKSVRPFEIALAEDIFNTWETGRATESLVANSGYRSSHNFLR
jgi:hypothetical protein